ncbi:MAG: hypothetical protein P4M14_03035 [Gammaproteobacteria bacterium]|nr:hypothetical protein [Gammaproteobacteria bacterium]
MNSSAEIKQNLCKEYQKVLEKSQRDQADETPCGSVGRGYAAVLLSLLNYGYNVATRRPLPTTEPVLARKETGIVCPLEKEGRYSRSEIQHPGYDVVKTLFKSINNSKLNERSKLIIKDHYARYEKGVKDRGGAWLGQMKSPEELLQDVFAELAFSEVVTASLELLEPKSEKKLNQEQGQEEKSDYPDELVASEPSSAEKKEDEKEKFNLNPLSFDNVMQSRMQALQRITENLDKDNKLSAILPFEAPQTDYPCLMFDLRNFAAKLGLNHQEGQKADKNLENLVKLIMCYFCGLVNSHSIRFYQGNFIWTQTQSSFGNLRPSLADTPPSFRFSLGLVPDNFSAVVKAAYKDLCEVLNDSSIQGILKQLIASLNSASAAAASHSSPIKKDKALFSFLSNAWADEDAQQYALFITETSDSPQAAFSAYLNQITILSNQPQSKQKRVRADANHQLTLKKIINDEQEAAVALAPNELTMLLTNMVLLAKNRMAENQKPYPLRDFENRLDEQTTAIIHEAERALESKDFSETTSCIETLSRLLLLKYELILTHERLKRLKKQNGQNDRRSLEASGFMSLSLSASANSGIFGLAPLSNANSLTESRFDMTLSKDTFPARSGMSAFVSVIKAILKVCNKEASYQFNDLVYFELTPDIFGEIQERAVAGDTPIGSPLAGPVSVAIADQSSFPSRPNGESTKTRWAGDWEKIDDKDRPQILIVDVTSCPKSDVAKLVTEFNKQPDRAPFFLMTFSSDNKFKQMGVDLVSMGEMRLFKKEGRASDESLNQKNLAIFSKLQEILAKSQENNSTAKAYRKLIADIGQRMSLKPDSAEELYYSIISEEDILLMAEAITEEGGVDIFRNPESSANLSLSQFLLEDPNAASLMMAPGSVFHSLANSPLLLAASANAASFQVGPSPEELLFSAQEKQLAEMTAENKKLRETIKQQLASLSEHEVQKERSDFTLEQKSQEILSLAKQLATFETVEKEHIKTNGDLNKDLALSKQRMKTQEELISSLLAEQDELKPKIQALTQKLGQVEQAALSQVATLSEENKQLKEVAKEVQHFRETSLALSAEKQKLVTQLLEHEKKLMSQQKQLVELQASLKEKAEESIAHQSQKQTMEAQRLEQEKRLQLQQTQLSNLSLNLRGKTQESVALLSENGTMKAKLLEANRAQYLLQAQQAEQAAEISALSSENQEIKAQRIESEAQNRIDREKLQAVRNKALAIQQLVRAHPVAPVKTAWWKYAMATVGCLVGGVALATGIGTALGLPLIALSISSVVGIGMAAGGGVSLISGFAYMGLSASADAVAQKQYEDQVAVQIANLNAVQLDNHNEDEERNPGPDADEQKHEGHRVADPIVDVLANELNPQREILPPANFQHDRSASYSPPSVLNHSIYRPNPVARAPQPQPPEQKLGRQSPSHL